MRNYWFTSLLSLLFPRCCIVCNKPLAKGEEVFCTYCNIKLPRIHRRMQRDNAVERLFWGKIPIERATAWFYYSSESDFRQILYRLKYRGRKEIGVTLGRYMAAELLPSGFFDGIDAIIPIPLHPQKERMRGYNQSERIAAGLSAITGIPVEAKAVSRIKNSETQTHKTATERWENVKQCFLLHQPEQFIERHILLIDDVLTTGATLLACASAFEGIENLKISILTLTIAE